MSNKYLLPALSASALLLGATTSQAELIGYEPFDYPSGTRAIALLADESTGFVTEDTNPDPDLTDGAYEAQNSWASLMSEGTLNYKPLMTSGNKFRIGFGGLVSVARFDVSEDGPYADYLDSAGEIGAEGETLYMSLLYKRDSSADPDQAFVNWAQFPSGAIPTNAEGAKQVPANVTDGAIAVGQGWTHNYYSATTGGAPGTANQIGPVDLNVHLIVVKFEWVAGGDDIATVWWDPDPTLAEDHADNTTRMYTLTRNFLNFNALHFKDQGPSEGGEGEVAGGLMVDEIRSGTSWEDVLPLAEFYGATITQPSEGGSISVSPEPDADDEYQNGTEVTVSAQVDTGYELTELVINGTTYDTAPQTFTVDGEVEISATIEEIPEYVLTVEVEPEEGGSVSLDTVALDPDDTDNEYTYREGTTVIATATAEDGYTFTGWTGAVESTDTAVAVDITGDLTLTANFESENTGGGDNPWEELSTVGGTAFKNTAELSSPGVGYIYDDLFPWIYSYGFGSGEWFYYFSDISEGEDSFYGYNAAGGYYFWANSSYGFYFDYGSSSWARFAGTEE